MQLTDSEFRIIVNYIKANYGIDLEQKRVLISGRLENYILRQGYHTYSEYIKHIERHPDGKEAANIINVLTTNHTYFMREFTHFEFMKSTALPWIKANEANRGKDVRIWSAASSTGEEPYTIEMVLKDYFSLDNTWNTQILATDISTRVLQKAKSGVYLEEQIQSLPEVWKRRYFKKISNEEYIVRDEIRKEIVFRQFNLMDDISFKGLFQIVFLRNVMIYFDEDTKKKLLGRISEHMVKGGYLFIGTTESIDKTGGMFQYVKPSIYRKI